MNHQGHGSTGTVGNRKARRGITREAQRKTAGPEAIAWYAKHNPAINPAKTRLNIDMVNDGAGGFRATESIDEVVAYGDERALRVKPGLKDGNRFAVTTVGHLPWAYLEPDGTEYQPVDATGVPKVFGSGPQMGRPIMEPRYRIKPDYEEKAKAYFEDWIEFQSGLLPDGRASMHGYSINLDESRPHIQLLSDPLEAAPSKKDPARLTNGFSRAFGSHPKDRVVPQLDGRGEPVLLPDGSAKMVREGASRKMERYQAELRDFMIDRGHEVEAERDEARHDRHLDLQDYKDLQHSQREVADTAQMYAADVGALLSEREHLEDGLIEAHQSLHEQVADELGPAMAAVAEAQAQIVETHRAGEAMLAEYKTALDAQRVDQTAREQSLIARTAVMTELETALIADKTTWDEVEKPALLAKVRAECVAALEQEWSQTRPVLVAQARTEGRAEGLAESEIDRVAAAQLLKDAQAAQTAAGASLARQTASENRLAAEEDERRQQAADRVLEYERTALAGIDARVGAEVERLAGPEVEAAKKAGFEKGMEIAKATLARARTELQAAYEGRHRELTALQDSLGRMLKSIPRDKWTPGMTLGYAKFSKETIARRDHMPQGNPPKRQAEATMNKYS
ncbi:UNVERIFIED_CONTAM: hypothetical protein DES50_102312 [Williamsia faeni]